MADTEFGAQEPHIIVPLIQPFAMRVALAYFLRDVYLAGSENLLEPWRS
jgi:hypothetical protein